jgi:hypothetical protein
MVIKKILIIIVHVMSVGIIKKSKMHFGFTFDMPAHYSHHQNFLLCVFCWCSILSASMEPIKAHVPRQEVSCELSTTHNCIHLPSRISIHTLALLKSVQQMENPDLAVNVLKVAFSINSFANMISEE